MAFHSGGSLVLSLNEKITHADRVKTNSSRLRKPSFEETLPPLTSTPSSSPTQSPAPPKKESSVINTVINDSRLSRSEPTFFYKKPTLHVGSRVFIKNIWKKIAVNGVNPAMERFRQETEGKMAWTIHGIHLDDDRPHWEQIKDKNLKNSVLNVHGLLALGDVVSNENISSIFNSLIACCATKYVQSMNALNEMRHNEGYSETIRMLIPDEKLRNLFLAQILTSPEIQDMIKWMSLCHNEYLNNDNDRSEDNTTKPINPNAVVTSSVGHTVTSLDNFENQKLHQSYDINSMEEMNNIFNHFRGKFLDMVESPEGQQLIANLDVITEPEIPPLKLVDALLIQMFSEGMFFQFPFTVLFYLKSKQLLPQITYLNDLINWDESFHIKEGICLIFSILEAYGIDITVNVAWKTKIKKMALQSYLLCARYVRTYMKVDFPGFTSIQVYKHLKFLVNYRLFSLKQKPFFKKNDERAIFEWSDIDTLIHQELSEKEIEDAINESPLDFIQLVGLKTRVNFFEVPVDNYAQDTGVTDTTRKRDQHYTSSELNFFFDDYRKNKSRLFT